MPRRRDRANLQARDDVFLVKRGSVKSALPHQVRAKSCFRWVWPRRPRSSALDVDFLKSCVKTTTVESTALRSHWTKSYLRRGRSKRRALGLESKICFVRCHAEMHNRMLNTRSRINSVSASEL